MKYNILFFMLISVTSGICFAAASSSTAKPGFILSQDRSKRLEQLTKLTWRKLVITQFIEDIKQCLGRHKTIAVLKKEARGRDHEKFDKEYERIVAIFNPNILALFAALDATNVKLEEATRQKYILWCNGIIKNQAEEDSLVAAELEKWKFRQAAEEKEQAAQQQAKAAQQEATAYASEIISDITAKAMLEVEARQAEQQAKAAEHARIAQARAEAEAKEAQEAKERARKEAQGIALAAPSSFFTKRK